MNFVNIVEFHTTGGARDLDEHIFVSLDTGLVKWSNSKGEKGSENVASQWFNKWKDEFMKIIVFEPKKEEKDDRDLQERILASLLRQWSTYNGRNVRWNPLSYKRMVKYLSLDKNEDGILTKRDRPEFHIIMAK